MPKLIVNFTAAERRELAAAAPSVFLYDSLVKKYKGIKEVVATDNPHEFIVIPGDTPKRPAWPCFTNFLSRFNENNKTVLRLFLGQRLVRIFYKILKLLGQLLVILIIAWGSFIGLGALLLILDLVFPGLLSPNLSH